MTRSLSAEDALKGLAEANPVPPAHIADLVRDPDVHAVLEQIVASPPERRASRARRPSRPVALGAAALLAAAGTAAVATGVPQSVRHALDSGPSGDQATLVDDARMIGSVETQGFDFQLWFAPTRDGGSCTYLEVAHHGEKPDGPVSCTYPHDGDLPTSASAISAGFEDTNPGVESYPQDTVDRGPQAKPVGRDPDAPLIIMGEVRPPAAVVDVLSADGRTSRVRVRHGYFLAPLGPEGAGGAYRLTARAADGTVLGRRCIGKACPSAPPTTGGSRSAR